MKLKTFILSAIALIGMATPAFAKGYYAVCTVIDILSVCEH